MRVIRLAGVVWLRRPGELAEEAAAKFSVPSSALWFHRLSPAARRLGLSAVVTAQGGRGGPTLGRSCVVF